jgi:hypothetical protein
MENYETVTTASGQLAAEMIKAFLVSNGIPAILNQESAGIVYGLTVGPLGEVQVLVPVERLEEAKKILADMDKGKYIVDDDQGDSNPAEQ